MTTFLFLIANHWFSHSPKKNAGSKIADVPITEDFPPPLSNNFYYCVNCNYNKNGSFPPMGNDPKECVYFLAASQILRIRWQISHFPNPHYQIETEPRFRIVQIHPQNFLYSL
ncbi:hypothetical protein BBOR36S_04975 [Brevibacillus borstelensis]